MSEQPDWMCIEATDSWAIFVDTTGVYEPEMEYAEDLGEGAGYRLYRFTLERKQICCTEDDCTKTHLVPYGFPGRTDLPYPIHKYEEWFSESVPRLAEFVGENPAAFREALCSENPRDRARAYGTIGDYHGYLNLDGYPAEFTDEGLELRRKNLWKEHHA